MKATGLSASALVFISARIIQIIVPVVIIPSQYPHRSFSTCHLLVPWCFPSSILPDKRAFSISNMPALPQ